MNEKPYLLLIHGLKKHNENSFKHLEAYFKDNDIDKDFEVVNFVYYDNLNKETISSKQFKKMIREKLVSLSGKDAYVIGYSMGGVASLTLTHDFPNVKKIIAVVPVLSINRMHFPKKTFSNIKTGYKMKKKLGKVRYDRIKSLKSKGIAEKHPIRIIVQTNKFRKIARKDLKRQKNKEILLLFSSRDEINNLKSTIDYLNKNLNYSSNDLEIKFTNETHYELLSKNAIRNFKIITEFLKK